MIQKTYQPQQYTLNVATSRITITAGSEVGIGYALKTLYQYAISAVAGELPQTAPLWTAPYTIDRPCRARRRYANAAAAQHPFLFPPIALGAQRAWHPHTDKRSIGHVAQWMNCYLFCDHRHAIADIVCALAMITERHQFDLVNASVLHCMLLGDSFPYYRPLYRQFSAHNYDAFLSEMGSLHEALTALPQSLVTQELLWSIDAVSLAAECIERISRMQQPALSAIPQAEAKALGDQLARYAARYRALWHQRSRRGGLQDSAARLLRTARELSGATP